MKRHAAPIALGLLIVVVSAVNLAWILRDQAPLPVGDSYIYLTRLLRFVDHLGSGGLFDIDGALNRLCHGWRAPLYQLLTVPFVWVFGRSEDAATAVNFAFWILLLVSVYHVGKLVGNRWVGLLAAVLAASYPPLIQLSRMFLTHSALPACVALSTGLLLLVVKERSVLSAWLFSASLAFGVLIHATFALMMVIPAVVVGAYSIFFQTSPTRPASLRQTPAWVWSKLRDPLAAWGLVPAGLSAAAVAVAWYGTWGRKVIDVQQSLLSDRVTELRGKSAVVRGFPELSLDSWWFALSAPGAISLPFALAGAIGVVYAAVKWRRPSLVLALIVVAAYAVLAWRRVFTWMYFAPVLPVIAVLSALWIVNLRPKKLAAVVAAVAVTIAGLTFSLVTWGEKAWNRPLVQALGAPLGSNTCKVAVTMAFCPMPAQTDSWPIIEILDSILKDRRCVKDNRCKLMMLQVGEFKAPLFQYHQIRAWKRLRVPVNSQGHLGMGHRFQLQSFLKSEYMLFPRLSRQEGSDRNYLVAGSRFLQCPPLSFAAAHETVGLFELPDGKTAELIRRTRSLSLQEAEDSIAALELADVYKQGKDVLLRRLAADPRRRREGPARLPVRGDDLDKWIETGEECLRQGYPDRALQYLEPAVARAPGRKEIYPVLTRTYRALGAGDAMLPMLERALAVGGEEVTTMTMLANQYRLLGRNSEAIELYRKVVDQKGGTAAVLSSLANSLRVVGELDEAADMLGLAIKKEPREIWRYFLLARLQVQRGKPQQARELYRQILEIDPKNIRASRMLDAN